MQPEQNVPPAQPEQRHLDITSQARDSIHSRIRARVRAPYGWTSTNVVPWAPPGYSTICLSREPTLSKMDRASSRGARVSCREPTYRNGADRLRTPLASLIP